MSDPLANLTSTGSGLARVPEALPQLRPPRGPQPVGPTGQDMLDATLPLQFAEGETDYAWSAFLGALSTLLDPIAEVVRDDADGNPGWTCIAAPRRCPPAWLRVLSQWAGFRRWDSLAEEDLRELLDGNAPGFWRGTKRAMIASVRRFFPPGFEAERFLFFRERAGGAYRLVVFTYSFVPHDEELVQDTLEATKPALLNLRYEVRIGQTWEMLNRRKANWLEVREDYADWYAVLTDEPLPAE